MSFFRRCPLASLPQAVLPGTGCGLYVDVTGTSSFLVTSECFRRSIPTVADQFAVLSLSSCWFNFTLFTPHDKLKGLNLKRATQRGSSEIWGNDRSRFLKQNSTWGTPRKISRKSSSLREWDGLSDHSPRSRSWGRPHSGYSLRAYSTFAGHHWESIASIDVGAFDFDQEAWELCRVVSIVHSRMKLANLKSLTGRNKKIPKAFRVREPGHWLSSRISRSPS